jgi:hypothetical protein
MSGKFFSTFFECPEKFFSTSSLPPRSPTFLGKIVAKIKMCCRASSAFAGQF